MENINAEYDYQTNDFQRSVNYDEPQHNTTQHNTTPSIPYVLETDSTLEELAVKLGYSLAVLLKLNQNYTATQKIEGNTTIYVPVPDNNALKNTADHDNVNTTIPSVSGKINNELQKELAKIPIEIEDEEGSWLDWVVAFAVDILVEVASAALENVLDATGINIVIKIVKIADALLSGDNEKAAELAMELVVEIAKKAIPGLSTVENIVNKLKVVADVTTAVIEGDVNKIVDIVADEAISKISEKATHKIQNQAETWKNEKEQGIVPEIPLLENKKPRVIVDARVDKLKEDIEKRKIELPQEPIKIPAPEKEKVLVEVDNTKKDKKPTQEPKKADENKKLSDINASNTQRLKSIEKDKEYLLESDKALFDKVVSEEYHTSSPDQIKERQDNIDHLEAAVVNGKKNAKKHPAQAAIDDLKLNKLKSKLEGADQPIRDRFYDDFETLNDDKKAALRAMDSDDKVFEAWKIAGTLSSKTRTNPLFLDKLKTLRADTELQDHIFNIHQKNNKVSGGHIQSVINGTTTRYKNGQNGGINPPPNSPMNQHGVLNADVEVLRTILKPDRTPELNPDGSIKQIWQEKKLRGGDIQTFFPANWSKDKILAECASALVNPQKGLAAGKSRVWEASSDSGVVIGWYIENDKITTIFPKL